ncbi:hypothetical protein [Streptomyces sp. NPDC023838]|uniref:hypothetical protein n=1 Tax=Streptomyces sp. NPDC023838 TaxID=3154325 RepID=UPI0033C2C5B8
MPYSPTAAAAGIPPGQETAKNIAAARGSRPTFLGDVIPGGRRDMTQTINVRRLMTALFTLATFALLLYTIGGPERSVHTQLQPHRGGTAQ